MTNPFFKAHNVIPKQPHLSQLATLLMQPQGATHIAGPGQLTPDEITMTAHKKRPLSSGAPIGPNNSLPKGDASGI